MSNIVKKEKRIDIMNIASELFYSNGVAETTISAITYKANIGKGTFYEYFKNKDDVINEYIKAYFEKVFIEINKKIDTYKTYKEKILFITEFFLISKIKDKKFIFLYIEFLRTDYIKKEKHSSLYQLLNNYQKIIEKYLKLGIEKKEFIKCNTKEISFEIITNISGNLVLSSSFRIKGYEYSEVLNIIRILDSIKY
ncbi:TetR/AcrR family transcriptional regulator [Arcobacter sp. LA11]|uniref:TetR/AcrR family transcriptional regulator n=1 Tax=Arcobacter sp. LA11 TaxID=1898176 RepID=UPI000932FBA9|nr:TetR/AcrR family transcriptional regulator [Arcobacter sp. LA11]